MTIYGTPNNKVHDDQGNVRIKNLILSKYPSAVELDRPPEQYESYVYGTGYIKDVDQEIIDQAEVIRQAEISDEFNSHEWKGKSPVWVKNRIDTRIDATSLQQADKDIISTLLKKSAMLNFK